ncbi:cytochrome P450 [Nonomuraea sp. NPDC003201]
MALSTSQTSVETLLADLLIGEGGRTDPHSLCTKIRELGPVHSTKYGLWFTTTYQETRTALRDARFTRGDVNARVERDPRLKGSLLFEWEKTVLPFIDPPDHTRLRRLMGSALTVQYMMSQAPKAREFAARVLRRAEADGAVDLVRDLAEPLPFWLTAEMLAIPENDRPAIHRWTAIRAESLQRMTAATPLEPTNQALQESHEYLLRLIAARRRELSDDLLSRLITAEVDGEHLSDFEIAANINQLFSAGLDTVKYLIGNAFHALLTDPAELNRLRGAPELGRNAVEETLRYEGGMVIAPARMLAEDVRLGGRDIPSGSYVCPILLSGNRDPQRHDDPDRFRIDRPNPQPLTFGGGIHRCLGAALARVQATECLIAFAGMSARVELVPERCVFSTDIGRRGPDRLPVVLA